MNRLLILFLTLSAASYSLAAKDTKCSKGGEYCLSHWDCCTNTCLSFLYKCSSIPSTDLNPSPVYRPPAYSSPSAASPTTTDDTISYESLLESIFSPRRFVANAFDSEVSSIKTRLGDASGEEESIKTKTEEARTEEDVIITKIKDGPQCLQIGSKCYANEKCCTKRCHGFLHQCVT